MGWEREEGRSGNAVPSVNNRAVGLPFKVLLEPIRKTADSRIAPDTVATNLRRKENRNRQGIHQRKAPHEGVWR